MDCVSIGLLRQNRQTTPPPPSPLVFSAVDRHIERSFSSDFPLASLSKSLLLILLRVSSLDAKFVTTPIKYAYSVTSLYSNQMHTQPNFVDFS
eukprot:6180930-Pleurochrysis_carterae.AAC.3